MGGYYDSPEITCNVSQSSVDREKSVGFFFGFLDEYDCQSYSPLSGDHLVNGILGKVNWDRNRNLVLPLGTGKTFLFFRKHRTVVADTSDRDFDQDGANSGCMS